VYHVLFSWVREIASGDWCKAEKNVGRNKLAQFRQPYGKRTVAMPELRKLVPAYGEAQRQKPDCIAPTIKPARNAAMRA